MCLITSMSDTRNAHRFRRAGHQAIEEVAAYYEKLQLGSKGFQVAPSIRPGEIYAQIPGGRPGPSPAKALEAN